MTTTSAFPDSEYTKTVSLHDALDAMVQTDATNFADIDAEISEATSGRIELLASIFNMTSFDIEEKLRDMTIETNEIALDNDEDYAICLKAGEAGVSGS